MRKCAWFAGLLLVGAVAHGQQSVVDTAHNLSINTHRGMSRQSLVHLTCSIALPTPTVRTAVNQK